MEVDMARMPVMLLVELLNDLLKTTFSPEIPFRMQNRCKSTVIVISVWGLNLTNVVIADGLFSVSKQKMLIEV